MSSLKISTDSIKMTEKLAAELRQATRDNPSQTFAVLSKGQPAYQFGSTSYSTGASDEVVAMTWEEAQAVNAPVLTALRAPALAPPVSADVRPPEDRYLALKSKQFAILTPPNTHIGRVQIHAGLRGDARSLYGFNGFVVRLGTRSTSLEFNKADLDMGQTELPNKASTALSFHRTSYSLEVVSLTPSDARSIWFEKFASHLSTKTVDLYCWQGSLLKDQLKKFVHHKNEVNALTAATLVLKQHADFEGTAIVFSYAPRTVANDLRSHWKLAQALGTEMFAYLLECILKDLETSIAAKKTPKTAMLEAACDLLVANLKRGDHHAIIHNDHRALEEKIKKVSQLLYPVENKADDINVSLFGLKCGLAYSAVVNVAADAALKNEGHRRVLLGIIKIFGEALSAGSKKVPIVGDTVASGADATNDLVLNFINDKLKKHDKTVGMINEAIKSFNVDVLRNARAQFILRLDGGELTPEKVTEELAKSFIDQATLALSHTLPEGVTFKEQAT